MSTPVKEIGARYLGVDTEQVRIEPVSQSIFPQWTISWVMDDNIPPDSVAVGWNGNSAEVITSEGGMAPLLSERENPPASLTEAVAVVGLFVELVHPMAEWAVSIDSIPGVTDAQRAVWARRIRPPTAERFGNGFKVEGLLWEQGQIQSATFILENNRIRSELGEPQPLGLAITVE